MPMAHPPTVSNAYAIDATANAADAAIRRIDSASGSRVLCDLSDVSCRGAGSAVSGGGESSSASSNV